MVSLKSKELGIPERYWTASMNNLAIPNFYHQPIMDWLKEPKHMMILSGTPGTGKTHLCAAIINDLWNNKEVRFFRDDDLYIQAKAVLNQNWDGCKYILEKCDVKYLIIDDFGIDEVTPYKLQCTERLIDFRYSKGKSCATIINTNLSPEEIRLKYSQRILSRLLSTENTFVAFAGYDLRESLY